MMTSTVAPTTNRNPGIVPPWLSQPRPKNPGIVPPWLQTPIRILPVEDEVHILPVDGETQFVSEAAFVSPTSLADALRGR
jgi:hypothetical protein